MADAEAEPAPSSAPAASNLGSLSSDTACVEHAQQSAIESDFTLVEAPLEPTSMYVAGFSVPLARILHLEGVPAQAVSTLAPNTVEEVIACTTPMPFAQYSAAVLVACLADLSHMSPLNHTDVGPSGPTRPRPIL